MAPEWKCKYHSSGVYSMLYDCVAAWVIMSPHHQDEACVYTFTVLLDVTMEDEGKKKKENEEKKNPMILKE